MQDNRNGLVWLLMILLAGLCTTGCCQMRAERPAAAHSATPDAATDSLVASLRTGDKKELKNILGGQADDLISSGDPVADKNGVESFLKSFDDKHQLVPGSDGSVNLVVGDSDWPLPIPLVKNDKGEWYFDTLAGKDEIINRRVGRNELDTIQACLAIVDAQREYATTDPDHDGIEEYAQKFMSDPGKKNGLYWPTKEGEPPSPLGPLVATAQAQGYGNAAAKKGNPYLGYHYRMLKSQGPNAPGGTLDYVTNGRMLLGFGVVAYPADYGSSGVMTFIVSADGMVYQRDLGDDTAKIAQAMTAYDPGPGWTKVEPAATRPMMP